MKNYFKKYENLILTDIYILILFCFVIIRYDFYYALNDDVMIKDILAGIYTGTPESSNIQMLYPLSLVLSLFYRLVPVIPWFGLFLVLCQFGSLYLIAYRSLKYCQTPAKKMLLLFTQLILITATMLEHIVFVQYTITSAMLTTAAVFWFITSDSGEDKTFFIKANIPAIILIFLAFTLRPWMLWLLLPFAGITGLYKWSRETEFFTKQNFAKYLTLFGILILTLFVALIIDKLAHSSEEWRKFNLFFANRTRLYDFQSIPEFEANIAFYESIGFTSGEVSLLENYNFGLSDKINEITIGQVADYAQSQSTENLSFKQRLSEQIRPYIFTMTSGRQFGHFPYNSLVILGYTTLLGIGIFYNRLGRIMSVLLMMGGVRTGIWLFILMGDRYPVRISHSLFFIEMVILFAFILIEITESPPKVVRKSVPYIIAVAALIIALGNIQPYLRTIDFAFSYHENVNKNWIAMQKFTARQPGNFYFVDVYSSIFYTEKIFANNSPRPVNYDIMGGWVVNSPLHRKKLDRQIGTGVTMFEALRDHDNVFLIINPAKDMSWLPDYYHERGYEIKMVRTGLIEDKTINRKTGIIGTGKLEVYKLR